MQWHRIFSICELGSGRHDFSRAEKLTVPSPQKNWGTSRLLENFEKAVAELFGM